PTQGLLVGGLDYVVAVVGEGAIGIAEQQVDLDWQSLGETRPHRSQRSVGSVDDDAQRSESLGGNELQHVTIELGADVPGAELAMLGCVLVGVIEDRVL